MALRPASPDTARLLQARFLQEGVTSHRAGDLDGAARAYRKVLKKNPREPDALHLLGVALNQSGNPQEGANAIAQALGVRDDFPDAHLNLGIILAKSGNTKDAEHHFRRAVYFRPAFAGAQINLGLLLRNTGRIEEAMGCFAAVLRQEPGNTEALVERARTLRLGNDARSLLAASQAGLQVTSQLMLLHIMAAEAFFALGRLREGWRHYRARFQSPENTVAGKTYPLPLWQGEPLAARTILIWGEQAPGDEIMYANMLPDIIAAAGRCIIQCSPRLAPLFRRSFPGTEIYDRDLSPAEIEGIAFQSPIASLGEWLRPDFTSFPVHRGYLRADPTLRAALRAKYNGGDETKLIVGISWRSAAPVNGADKSLNILEWGPIFHIPGVVFVNLQYGETATERATVRRGFGIEVIHDDTIDSLKDLDGYAAQIAAMDIVVSSSNTAAHVAGALGVSTLCLLPATLAQGRRWYWFADHGSCPWYPSMRLFRQSRRGWLELINDAALALLDLATARTGIDPANYLRAIAQAFVKTGRIDDAEIFYRRLGREPGCEPEALLRVADLKATADPAQAIALLDQAVTIDPQFWHAYNVKGAILNDLRRYEDAVVVFRKGLAYSQAAEMRSNLGGALIRLGHHAEGEREVRLAFEDSAAASDTVRNAIALNYANALGDGSNPAQAIEILRDAIARAPDLVDAHYNLGIILLSLGRFGEGWPEFAWRLNRSNMAAYVFPAPRWNGQDITGKRVLIWTEQGLGDEILIANMLPDVIAAAKHVVFLCSARLMPLMRRAFPTAEVAERTEPLPKAATAADIDYQMSLSDLGSAFRRSFSDFPSRDRLLTADRQRRDALRAKYNARQPGAPLIGLSWSSKHNHKLGWLKSMDLADWHPILQTPGVTFVNLQYGDWTAALTGVRDRLGVDIIDDPAIDPLEDMDAFAAQVAAMDLVISVSNTTVHVAGALGIPTWVMPPLGRGRMWYWFRDRTESPWYSSVRLLTRDGAPEDGMSHEGGGWQPLIARCAAELGDWLKSRTR